MTPGSNREVLPDGSVRITSLTVAIARHLSRTDRLIQIHSDPAVFETQLEAACNRRR